VLLWEREVVDILKKAYDLNLKLSNPSPPVFAWRMRKPTLYYHSDSAARSTQDTPEVRKLKQKSDVGLRRNLMTHFQVNKLPKLPNEDESTDCSMDVIEDNVSPSKLHNMSCFDIVLATDSKDFPRRLRRSSAVARTRHSALRGSMGTRDGAPAFTNFSPRNPEVSNSRRSPKITTVLLRSLEVSRTCI
jgi:hypothetical protein